jgi:hypothetical protein
MPSAIATLASISTGGYEREMLTYLDCSEAIRMQSTRIGDDLALTQAHSICATNLVFMV